MFTNHQFISPSHRICPLMLALVFLTQCSHVTAPSAPSTDHLSDLSEKTVADSYHTATSPLDDFGLREEEIPHPLQVAMNAPYAYPKHVQCRALRAEIAQLDALLGADVDAHAADAVAAKSSDAMDIDGDALLERGEEFAHDSVVGFVKAQTSFLPFRSVIRQITGANKHEKEVARAQESGRLRRAYLKGILQTSDSKCPALPAALPHVPAPHIEEARATVL